MKLVQITDKSLDHGEYRGWVMNAMEGEFSEFTSKRSFAGSVRFSVISIS
jgi:hypothetical protein